MKPKSKRKLSAAPCPQPETDGGGSAAARESLPDASNSSAPAPHPVLNESESNQAPEVPPKRITEKKGRKRDWKKAFLDAFRTIGIVGPAAAHAGVTRHAVRKATIRDPKFATAYEEALADSTERLEAVAFARASREKEPSDVLLIFLLKARRPEVYREMRFALQHSGPNEGPIQQHHTGSVLVLPAEEIDRLTDGEAERLSGAAQVNGENGEGGGEEGEQGNGAFYTPARPTA